MQSLRRGRYGWSLVVVLALGAGLWFLWPGPALVDLGSAHVGAIAETVEEEARTRVRNVYTVSAPVAGRVVRTSLRVGDEVIGGKTVVATIRPTLPSFIDDRLRAELRAALTGADASMELARHEIRRLEVERDLARRELERTEALAKKNVVASEPLEQVRTRFRISQHALDAANAQLEIRRNERSSIEMQLRDPDTDPASAGDAREIHLNSPASGEVLHILQESEAVVAAGTPLIDIADTGDLEVVADLLSTDAVRVNIGAPALIVDWGGPPIEGRVSHVEPAGFKEVSALGIEELRVNVIVELTSPRQIWSRLGHGYRVTARITLWQADDVLTVPVASLFRKGEAWATFAVEGGRASLREVKIGRSNEGSAEVLEGLSEGDPVILYPSDRIHDGVRVAERETQ